MSQPLTDDQLRQVATHMAVQHGREQVDDRLGIGEMLDDTLDELEIELRDDKGDAIQAYDLDDDVFDAILDRVRDLIRDARITVEWPVDTAHLDDLSDSEVEAGAVAQLRELVASYRADAAAHGWATATKATLDLLDAQQDRDALAGLALVALGQLARQTPGGAA